jgi:hypothetical protein
MRVYQDLVNPSESDTISMADAGSSLLTFVLTTSARIEIVNLQTLPTFRSGPASLITSATPQVPRLGTQLDFELSLQSDRLGYGRRHRAGEHRGDDESFVAPASIGSSLRGTTIGRQFDVD